MKIEIVSCKVARFMNPLTIPCRCAACGMLWSSEQIRNQVVIWYPILYDQYTEYRQVYVCNSIYCATGWPPMSEINS